MLRVDYRTSIGSREIIGEPVGRGLLLLLQISWCVCVGGGGGGVLVCRRDDPVNPKCCQQEQDVNKEGWQVTFVFCL